MNSKIKTFLIFAFTFLAIGVTVHSYSRAAVALPQPPTRNQHAPKTNEDKNRVAFAEKIITTLLKSKQFENRPITQPPTLNKRVQGLKITPDCLSDFQCLSENDKLVSLVRKFQEKNGIITHFKHTHIIPWSFEKFERNRKTTKKSSQPNSEIAVNPGVMRYTKSKRPAQGLADEPPMEKPVTNSDEYLIHVYVQFDKSVSWHHLDLIVGEDEDGRLTFRDLFVIPMPLPSHKLPPGVVC